MTHSLLSAHQQQPLQSYSASTTNSHLSPPRSYTYLPVPPSAPKLPSYKYWPLPQNRAVSNFAACQFSKMKEAHDAQKLRSAFLDVLRSRRSSEVALSVEPAKPVANPLFQEASPPRYSEAMNACPKANITNLKDKLQEENLYLITEAGEQGRLPVLILTLKENNAEKRPAIVFLHSTNKNKEWLRPLLEAYASRGYVAVAIDSRYHGERASSLNTYRDALISSWKKGNTMPFIFDTTWDLIKLADYLTTQREDIDPTKIGITGESLGGMHAWFAAFADTRYAVVVPIIGVQGFGWAIDNNMWQARVDSIKPVFEEARIDLGKTEIDKQVVEKVWDRIAPGLASQFDSPFSVPAIAPRPLLILNGAKDPRCPVGGLEIPKSRARKAYEDEHSIGNFEVIEQPEIEHQMTSLMVIEASHWFDHFLMGSNTKDDIFPGAKQSDAVKLSRSASRSESVSDSGDTELTPMEAAPDARKLRSQFLSVLRSRRSGEVPLSIEPAKPVTNPLFQEDSPPDSSEIEVMNSCPKANIHNLKDKLKEENICLITEAGEQGRLPVLILSMKESNTQKRPAIVFLHRTNMNKEWLRPLLEAYASRGYVTIAIDSRYHGERASSISTYQDALISSWKKGDTMPFVFDTVWDLIKLADYLTQREDVDPSRIGISGESLGGMHAWFAAAADTRYTVVVPIIGVQGFRWAIDNDKWQARINSIKPVFEEARIDLGKSEIDKEVVEKVWDRIAPGLASQFDSPYSIPAIAPRPLLILAGVEDRRCPIAGLEIPKSRATKAYEDANSIHNFNLIAQPRIWHRMTPVMVKEASDWFDRFLKP